MPPSSSNQSMPVDSASLNSPAGRISFPSASTRQPASDQVLGDLVAIRLAGSSSVPGSSRGSLASRKPSSNSLISAATLGAGIAADDQSQLGRDGQRRGPPGRDDGTVIVELELAEQLVGRQTPVLARRVRKVRQGRGLASISSRRIDSTSSRGGTRVSARIRPSIKSCWGSTKVISFS